MPLVRMMARTAVVAGTATAVSNRVSRRQAGRWAQQEQADAYQQEQYAQAAAPPPAAEPAEDPTIARLKELASLRDAGVLTEEEFAAEKAKVLG
jgi:membrane protease subunit (stomatin/prohibitin family)